jgi:hypothetical protein
MVKRPRPTRTIGTTKGDAAEAPGPSGAPAEGGSRTRLEIRAEKVHFMEQAPNAVVQPGPGIPQRTDEGGRAPF